MKKWILLVFIIVLLLPGCHKQGTKIAMPETLKLETQLPREYPKKANVYQVNWNEIDGDIAEQTLFINDTSNCIDEYEDIQYVADDNDSTEALLVFRMYRESGLSYKYNTDLDWIGYHGFEYPLYEMVKKYREPDQSLQLIYENQKLQEYPSTGDLDFMKQKDALVEIESKMKSCGFAEFELYDVQVMDADTMNQNLEIYNQTAKEINEYTEGLVEQGLWEWPFELVIADYTFEKADERYVFEFRQVQDGIPFANVIWVQQIREISTETLMEAVYSSRNGLETLWAENIYTVGDVIRECEIMSPEEALKIYVDEYSQAIHFENTAITKMELCYVVVMDGDALCAKPAWILSMHTERKGSDEWENRDWLEYQHLAINAETGVILEGEKDLR